MTKPSTKKQSGSTHNQVPRQTGLIDALMQINPINLVVLRELLQR